MEVEPEKINTEQHFWDAFGNVETEISARWIVRFCQERKRGWEPFSKSEIEQFYNQHGYVHFMFNKLLSRDQRYVRVEGDAYSVTPEFVDRCYQASPLVG